MSNIEIFGTIVHETPDAFLVDTGDDENVWLPKSKTDHDTDCNIFTLPKWLAKEKGLI